MKTVKYILVALLVLLAACSDLDLTPRNAASTENWFQNPEQFEMNLNALLLHQFWPQERNEWDATERAELDTFTDDNTNRQSVSGFINGGLNSSNPVVARMWDITYTAINRCNTIIHQLKAHKEEFDPDDYDRIMANARFYRACFYSRIMMYFGDPVVVDEDMDMESEEGRESAYQLSRSSMWSVLNDVLNEFDYAAQILPIKYETSEVERATRGAAYGMKARTALHFASIRKWDTYGLGDAAEAERLFDVAAKAAKACIDLNAYTLHEDFGKLFLMSTKHSPEGIFVIPRSKALSNDSKWQYLYLGATRAKLPRLSGAPTCTTVCPSWDLLCAFICTDGKPIDESPLYDPHKPFVNRDPRCTYTIVEHGTEHLGVIYDPHFDKPEVYSSRYGGMVTNNDSRTYLITAASNNYASYDGLVLKKGIDNDWLSPFEAENDKILLRYADVLLMYAEAKMELNQIDQTVLDAINMVRARAYKVAYTATTGYPAVTVTDQAALRTVIRTERRMEFAFENLRYMDLFRWRMAEKVLNYYNYGLPRKNEALQRAYIDKNMWFHGAVPQIDEDGCPNFAAPVVSGEKTFFTSNSYALKLSLRKFSSYSYLWPIPISTMQVMKNITENNPGY